jgi:hypothetical protein
MNNLSRAGDYQQARREGCAGVSREFEGWSKRREREREKKKRNERIVKIEDEHYFKNKKIIRILAIELLNTILLLVF